MQGFIFEEPSSRIAVNGKLMLRSRVWRCGRVAGFCECGSEHPCSV